LYFGFKYLGPVWINRLLSAYFVLAGLGALAKVSSPLHRNLTEIGRGGGRELTGSWVGLVGFVRLEWRS